MTAHRPKVLAVIGQLESGGCERHLLNVLPGLNEAGFDCAIYTLRGGGALETALRAAGVRVIGPQHHSRRVLGLLRTAVHLWRTLFAERAEIVHFFLPEAYLLGGLCSLLAPAGIRVMSRRSLNRYQAKRPLLRPIERFLHRRMDWVLGNSERVLDELRREGVSPRRSSVIYNGVRPIAILDAEQRAETRTRLAIEAEVFVIVMVANLIPYKGHCDLLRGLAGVRTRLPHRWTLLLLGADRGMGHELRRLADALGLTAQVRWEGDVADVTPYLAAADLAVNASHEEGFSNAVLEALAAGLPQVLTEVGGNGEAVRHCSEGYLVPAKAPEKLGEAIAALAGDAEARQRFGRLARERAASDFSLAECVAAYQELYEKLLQRAPSGLPSVG